MGTITETVRTDGSCGDRRSPDAPPSPRPLTLVQLCGRQTGPSTFELTWSQRRIAQHLGISISTLRHHPAAAGAMVTSTNPLRVTIRGILFEAVGLDSSTVPNGFPGNRSLSFTPPLDPTPAERCTCGVQQVNVYLTGAPVHAVADAPTVHAVPGSAIGLAASLFEQAAALQHSAAELLRVAAAVLGGVDMVPARPVIEQHHRVHPSPAEPIAASRETRDAAREGPRERSRDKPREDRATFARVSDSQSELFSTKTLTDWGSPREAPRDQPREVVRESRDAVKPGETGSMVLDRAVVMEVIRPLWEKCERFRMGLPDERRLARLAAHSREDLERGVVHVGRQLAAGRATKPFGLLINMLEKDNLPAIPVPHVADLAPTTTTDPVDSDQPAGTVQQAQHADVAQEVDGWSGEQVEAFLAGRELPAGGLRVRSLPALRAMAKHFVTVDGEQR